MTARLRVAILGLLFWLVFTPLALGTLLGQLVDIILFAITGSEYRRDWVYSTGKGVDGLNNAAWLDGNPKETISSHVGRRYVAAARGLYTLTWQDKFVWWLTTKFEASHPVRSIEAPFVDQPL